MDASRQFSDDDRLAEALRRFGLPGVLAILVISVAPHPVLTSVVFALAHVPRQGLAGAEQALVTGLVFGTIFIATGRIFVVMCAHAAFDLAAVALIYWNLEQVAAHLVFR